MVIKIPDEKRKDSQNARFVDILPCSSINPTIRGMLAKWQGLKRMLKTPQIKEPINAINGEELSVFDNQVNISMSII
jgi:hypothetical protein